MELAQQVKTSLIVPDDQDTFYHSPRTSRLQRHHPHSHSNKRSTSSVLSNYSEDNDDNQPNKRLLNRRISQQSFQRVQSTKPKSSVEKSEQDLTNNLDESQDSGIWVSQSKKMRRNLLHHSCCNSFLLVNTHSLLRLTNR